MIDMAVTTRRTLEEYLGLEYPFEVIADSGGGYVIKFPDLSGCLTQVEDIKDVGPMAEEIRTLWIETAYEQGLDIPLPSLTEEYSGKFVIRAPRSLHRTLVEGAKREDVSLNHYVVTLLARGDAQSRIEGQIARLEEQLDAIHERLRYQVTGVPSTRSHSALSMVDFAEAVAA